jgi:PHP family Zn ribbon phosphoesterase
MEEKKQKEFLSKQDPEKIKFAKKNLGKFYQMFVQLCRKCKSKVLLNPQMREHEYCDKCQKRIKEIWNS